MVCCARRMRSGIADGVRRLCVQKGPVFHMRETDSGYDRIFNVCQVTTWTLVGVDCHSYMYTY